VLTLLLLSVTAAFRASALPARLAPSFREMAVSARMLPSNVVFVSRVADDRTSHCTLHALAPTTETVELGEVMSVLAIWKVQDAPASPAASSVSVPVRFDAPAVTQYTPGGRMSPVRSGPIVDEHPRASSAPYAVTRSALPGSDAGGTCSVPTFVHGAGNPTIAAPGLTPTSPVTTEAPVQVTVVPPMTA
jgi:hypothetical protein